VAGIRGTNAYRTFARGVRRDPTSGTCWLCGLPIDRALPYRDPTTGRVNARSWSLDHVLPLDDYPHLALVRSNARAAHYGCNAARGKRPPRRRQPVPRPLATTRAW
jgi:5-methylcytosine-specific restriction endonuclease McrA